MATSQRFTDMLNIKRAVRQRDAACVHCGMTNSQHVARYRRQLDVHRKTPASLYTVDGCEAVCKACHAGLPEKEPGQPDLAWASVPRNETAPATAGEAIAKTVARNLRAERARLRLTLKEAGERSGVHYVSISRYEQGKLPTLDALYKLAEAYGVEPGSLLPPMATVADLPPAPKKPRRKKP